MPSKYLLNEGKERMHAFQILLPAVISGRVRADSAAVLVNAWMPELLPARAARGGLQGGGPSWQPQSHPSVRQARGAT